MKRNIPFSPMEKRKNCGVILGLTGSLGSGKSFVSSLLAECGAKVICADQLAREAVEPGSDILLSIKEVFGEGVITSEGSLDRKKIAEIIFRVPLKRCELEQLIHPYVRKRASNLLQDYCEQPLVVLDVPLLFESKYETQCDFTVLVHLSEEERVRRLEENRSMTKAQIQERLAAQMSQKDKMARADFLIDNSTSRFETAKQVANLLKKLFSGGLPHPLSFPLLEKFNL
jgi:dephospho-CoA kinase